MKILVTGAAGFIGSAVCETLLAQGYEVLGIDNINDYYDIRLKQARLERFNHHKQFRFKQIAIHDQAAFTECFNQFKPQRVIHLAAQAGVRYSLENPHAYVDSNLIGFMNVLEACRHGEVEHLVYASSSSVYGANGKHPYSIHDRVDHPVSLYAATKKSNEAMAHSYSHLYGLPVTGLRYFTVYGPWGRPDMAPFKFVKAITEGKPIAVYNHGQHKRDFTFVDDIVSGTVKVMQTVAKPNPDWSDTNPDTATSLAPYRIYNIGYGRPVALMRFIEIIEQSVGREAIKEMYPKQQGDVEATWADITELERDVGYKPKVALEDGIPQFVDWYKHFYLN